MTTQTTQETTMMTTQTVTITSEQGVGYRGLKGSRAYVAEITGSDLHYGLARSFIEAAKVERDHFGRARYIRTYTFRLSPGLYELAESGERRYLIVWMREGAAAWHRISSERLTEMVRLLDAGDDYETARLATRQTATPQPQQVQQ